MPRYKVKKKIYNIPEEEVEGFLITFPQAELLEEVKEQPTTQKDAEIVDVTQASNTELPLVDGSLELKETKYKTPLTLEEKKSLQNNKFAKQMSKEDNFTKERLAELEIENPEETSILKSLASRTARGFASAGKGLSQSQDMLMLGLMSFNNDFTAQEKILAKELLESGNIGSPAGFTKLPATDNFKELEEILSESVRKTENEDITSALNSLNFAEAAELTVGGALESIPSLLAAFTGYGGIAMLGASVAGNKFDEELRNNPEEAISALIVNAVGSGAIEAGFEIATRGILTKAGFIKNTQSVKAAKEFIKKGSESLVKKLGLSTLGEGLSEGLTELTSIAFDDIQLGKETSAGEGLSRFIDAFIIGSFIGGNIASVSEIGGASTAARNRAEYILTPQEIKKRYQGSAVQLSELSKSLKNAKSPESKKIILEQMEAIEQQIVKAKAEVSRTLDELTPEELNQYASNQEQILEKSNAVKAETDEKIIKTAKDQIQGLEQANIDLFGIAAQRILNKDIQFTEKEAGKYGLEVEVFEKPEDFANAKGVGTENINADGVVVGNKLLINKDRAAKVNAVSVGSHELLHGILKNAIADGSAGVEIINNFKKQLSNSQKKVVEARLKATDSDGNRLYSDEYLEKNPDEYLTAFSDAIQKKEISFEENIFTKLGDLITPLLRKIGFSKIKFNTGKDVYNFMREYNKSIKKGFLSKEIIEATGGDVTFDEAVKSKTAPRATVLEAINELVPTDVKTKEEFQSPRVFNPVFNSLINEGGAINNYIRSRTTSKQEAEKAIESVQDRLLNFDPAAVRKEGKTVGAEAFGEFIFANTNFGKLDAKKELFKESEKAKQETALDAPEVTTQVADEVSIDEDKVKSTTSKLRRVLGIKQDDAIYDLAKKVSEDILTGELPGKKVKTAINREARKSELRKAVSDLMGTEKAIDEQFLNKNILGILKALPASDLVKLEREAKVKVLAEQGPRLSVKEAREAVNKGLLPKDTNLQSGPKLSTKLPTTLEQAKEFFTQKRKQGLVNVITEMLVKDAAPEVTKGKMEPAKRAKVLSEIDREPTLKFSLSEASQVSNIVKAALLAGIKGKVTINNTNRKEKQKNLLEAIIEYGLTPNVFESAMPASSGAIRVKVGANNADARKLDKFLKENNIKSKKGTYYYALDNGNWVKGVRAKKADGSLGKQIVPPNGVTNLLASRGRMYYGKTDPTYIEALKAAKANLKGKVELKPKRVANNFFNKDQQKQSDINMQVLEDVATQLESAVAKGMDPSIAASLIAQGYQATGGLIKIAAKFKYKSKLYEYGYSLKQSTGNKYREEHNPPASVIGANLIWAITNNKLSEIMPSIKENFNQTLLSKKDDEKIDNAKLDATLPVGTTILDNPVTRIAASGINLNSIVNVKTGKTLAEENGIGVKPEFENNLEVYTKQNDLILKLNSDKDFTKAQAKKQIDQFVKVAPSIFKASKSNNDKSAFKYSETPTNKVTIETAATTDKALNIARDLNAPVKKIRVFDFDDTLAQTKSDVLYTMPDGTEGKLNAEQFASEGSTLLSEGAVFDFSEFNKVTEGKKGPLFKVAQTIAAKRGTEDVFVLTARAPESQLAIYEFLKSQGLDIPLKNITGLGDSTGDAKARWIVDKAADGYNDFYFADDAPQNVKAVRDALSVLDVKSKTQQAKIKFSKSLDLNKDFNDIIENKTGIASDKTYARVKAEVAGANKGRFNFFIPPSAEDFVGLLYSTLGKGDVGTAQMAWYKAHLLNPFARAMENLANDRVSMMQDYRGLKKALKIVPKNLRKKIKDSNFTKEQAVRVAIWDKQGMSVPGLSQKDQKELVDYVNADAELTVFAEQLVDINKGDEYASPDAGWVAGTIDTDFIKALNTTKRSKYLETWQQNADIIFSEANLNKLEAAYGKAYRVALENMLHRMKTGRNRSFGTDTITSRFTDWLTNSVGAIMFFNPRSAVLQTISAVNFINFTDNNVLKAGQAFANQPQYWSDFKKLFNSPFLLDRRSGIKLNVNEADIAEMAKGPGNSARNVVAGLLKLGFLPTQIADSFAIASGGATFYRNRIKALKKEGLTEAEAEEIAFRDFREIAEESQQSSRPDKISQQQAGPLGRVILAFANTPAQYARLIKKAASDLKNGRGDAKTNISKIIYYGVAQNLLFSALQQALFAIGFGDEDEEEEKRNEKYFSIANGMADSILRGIGVGGAVISVVKNTAIRLAKEADKKAPKYQDAVVKGVLQISPPVSSKVSKLQSAGRSFSWNQKEMKTMGFNIDNPAYLAGAQVISAVTNVPLDRAIKKITNIKDAGNENIEYYKRVALALGWSAWELGIKKDRKGKIKKVQPLTDMDKLYKLNKKEQIDSLLSLGLSKKQIKALKKEEDRVKAILDPKSVKEIKVSKRDSLFGLNKKEQVEALTKLGYSKKEIRALRLESDRVEAIINKQKQEN